MAAYCSTCNIGWQAQSCAARGAVDATTCWPPTTSGVAPLTTPPLFGWGFYSPGTLCPSGYAPACAATAGGVTDPAWTMQFRMVAGETAVGCCPK